MCEAAATRASPTTASSTRTTRYPRADGFGDRPIHRVTTRPDDSRVHAGQARVARLGRFGQLPVRALHQSPDDGVGKLSDAAAATQDVNGIGEPALVRYGRDRKRSRSGRLPRRRKSPGPCTSAVVAAASCPPLTADRCLRTVLSAWMSAPARSSVAVVCRLSSSVTPAAGTAINADAPPESSTSSESFEGTDAAYASARRPPSSLPCGRHRMTADDVLATRGSGRAGAAAPTTTPPARSTPGYSSPQPPWSPPPCPPR